MEEPQSGPSWEDDRSLKTADSLRTLRDQAGQALDHHCQRVSEIEAQLNEQLQNLSDELARERFAEEQSLAESTQQAATIDQLKQTATDRETEVEEVLEQLAAQSLEFETQLAGRDEELEQILELGEEESQQRESLQQEIDSARQELEDLRAQECLECAQIRDTLDATQQASLASQEQHEQVVSALAEAKKSNAELSQQLQDSKQDAGEHEQTRRKFELALADVHKLKRENAELREELLSRPEADDQESPELVSLRAERDALAERVSELENAPAPSPVADGQQMLEDLQSRFELAVDDVRQLKQEKLDLQEKLERSLAGDSTIVSEEPQDWQAQKARLLATLDAEDQGQINENRKEERATVEGTISITDRVVAEKDALLDKRDVKIANLRTQLEARPTEENLDGLREQIVAEVLGDDEAVKIECEKLQQQQLQLDAKLREAELEISVQRATLAREQASLEEKLVELSLAETDEKDSSSGKPRRRWLSALGIKDGEEE